MYGRCGPTPLGPVAVTYAPALGGGAERAISTAQGARRFSLHRNSRPLALLVQEVCATFVRQVTAMFKAAGLRAFVCADPRARR
jgi:hypothetical protein